MFGETPLLPPPPKKNIKSINVWRETRYILKRSAFYQFKLQTQTQARHHLWPIVIPQKTEGNKETTQIKGLKGFLSDNPAAVLNLNSGSWGKTILTVKSTSPNSSGQSILESPASQSAHPLECDLLKFNNSLLCVFPSRKAHSLLINDILPSCEVFIYFTDFSEKSFCSNTKTSA